jgi:hypothetical protein
VTKQLRRKLSGSVASLALLILALTGATEVKATPSIEWNVDHLNIDAPRGRPILSELSFVASKSFEAVEVDVRGAAGDVVSVVSEPPRNVIAGERRTIQLQVAAPTSGSHRYNGTLHLRPAGSSRTLGKPLPLNILAVEPVDATLTVVVHQEDGESPAPPETQVWLDGSAIGTVDAAGQLTTSVEPGRHQIGALQPFLAAARTDVDLQAGEYRTVELTMKSGSLPLLEDYGVSVVEADSGVIPADFGTLTIALARPSGDGIVSTHISHITLTPVGQVPQEYRHLPGEPIGAPVTLHAHFALSEDGTTIVATDIAAVRQRLLSQQGEFELRIVTSNVDIGLVYESFLRLAIGRHRVEGRLTAPPSNPSLLLDGIPVHLQVLGTSIEFTAVSGPAGEFLFPFVPTGPSRILTSTQSGDLHYSSAGTLMVDRIRYPRVALLTTADVVAGEREIVLASSPSALFEASPDPSFYSAERAAVSVENIVPPPYSITAAGDSVSVSVGAAQQNVAVQDTQTLDVADTVSALTLRFQVATVEYPYYVRSQSQFNDTWAIEVRTASGQVLFNITRNVNSQLHGAPQWQANGSTGPIEETIDISSLGAASGGTHQITIVARATNIGDSALPTYVDAELSTEDGLVISATGGMGTPFISVPRPGDTNHFPITAAVAIVSPSTGVDNTNVTSFSATLETANGTSQQVINEAGVGGPVAQTGATTTEQTVSFSGTNPAVSAINGTPPPANGLEYLFEVTADVSGASQTATVPIRGKHALWRMPSTILRFGPRDVGLDDWVAIGTYRWMETNAALLTRVNDVSGEHGRNIGHTTHRRGTDIDVFPFGNFLAAGNPPASSTNYAAAAQLAIDAIGGDAAALASLTAWIQAQRNGLQALAANGAVAQVRSARGAPNGVLPEGWAQSLLTIGTITDSAGAQLLSIGGTFGSPRVVYDHVHNTHNHIDLDDAQFRNIP